MSLCGRKWTQYINSLEDVDRELVSGMALYNIAAIVRVFFLWIKDLSANNLSI
jgi:hypothetical protein